MTNPTPLIRPTPFDAVESQLHALTIMPATTMMTPIMSTQMRDLDELGKMSAEAVLTQYEAAAKAVEEMGREVTTLVKRMGEKLIECDTDMKHLIETAAAIREKGKHSQALIEQVSALSTEIRRTCDEFKKKVGL
jgi:hypothetical protein